MIRTFKAITAPYLKRPWLLASWALALALGSALPRAAPLFFGRFANAAARGEVDWDAAWWILGIQAGAFALWRAADQMGYRMEISAVAQAFSGAFRHLIRHSYAFFSNEFSGALTKRVNSYAGSVERMGDFWFQAVNVLAGAAAVGGGLFFVRAELGWFFLAWLAACGAAGAWYQTRHAPLRREREKTHTALSSGVADTVGNIPTVLAFGAWGAEEERFSRRLADYGEAVRRTSSQWARFATGMNALRVLVLAGSVFAATWLISTGTGKPGDVVVLVAYSGVAMDLSWNLLMSIRQAYVLESDAREMLDILDRPHGMADAPGALPLRAGKGAVEFRNLSFGYGEGKEVFRNLSLSVRPGEKVAFVGESGAGKSSLVRLLLRFFDPQSGAVLVDGQDVSKVTQESLRAAISYVPQESLLFHRSLADNIAYGRPGAARAEIEEAGRLARVDAFVSRLPNGYGTVVGERGVKLSGGERQRVAIARAILKDAPVLVLDEPTSALDSESERVIQESLDLAMKGRTTLVVAHRLSTVMRADRIIVLHEGEIAEEGSHAELLKKPGGLYARLWELQSGGYLPDEDAETEKA